MCSMRKFYLILALILSFSLATWSQEIVVDSIRYYGDYMGKATIAAFQSKNLKGDIVIPSTVYAEGEPLTVYKFEQYAFSECTNIRSVTIPSSVNETLYDCGYEFYGCTSLEEVRLSPNMQVLQGTFIGCKALRKIVIPEGVKYMDYVFENCSVLDDVTLPESMLEIGIECFYGCTSLQKVILPSSVSSIGQDAFAYCRGLTSVTCLALIPPSCLGKRGPQWVTINPFNNIAANATLYVPVSALESYKNTYPWNTFHQIESCETANIADVTNFLLNKDDVWWNINGQKIRIPEHGVFIYQGKKYVK